jgi:hypothetical protein
MGKASGGVAEGVDGVEEGAADLFNAERGIGLNGNGSQGVVADDLLGGLGLR